MISRQDASNIFEIQNLQRDAGNICEIREIFERDGKYFRDTGDFAKDTGNISETRDLFVFGIVCG